MKLRTRLLIGFTILTLLTTMLSGVFAQSSAPETKAVTITLSVDEASASELLNTIWNLLPLPDYLATLSLEANFKPENLLCANLILEVPIVGSIALAHACTKVTVVDGNVSIALDSYGVGASLTPDQASYIKNAKKAAKKVKKAFKKLINQQLLGWEVVSISTTDTELLIVVSNGS